MGRASKWIRNLLAGKKEEKAEKNLKGSSSGRSDTKFYCAENLMLSASILPEESPKVKARWSFSSRSSTSSSAATEPSHYLKISRSFDSLVSANQQLITTAASLKYQTFRQITELSVPTQQVAVLPKTTIPAQLLSVPAPAATEELVENSAATRIQSFFRSYLARRALLALRGLVKLQALVRGHLVRKQTTATMRCIHALITIQVRARVQRIQMAKEEEAALVPKRQSTASAVNRHQRASYDEQRMVADDMKRTGKNSSSNTDSSRKLSFLRPDQCLPASPNPFKNQFCPFREFPLTASHTSPHYTSPDTEIYPMEAPHFVPSLEYANQITWMPNYMANTESSIAKLRSHSEPKQRPKSSDKQTTRRSTSSEEIGIAQEDFRVLRQFSDARLNTQKNRWLNKLRRPTRKAIKDNQGDAISKTGKSNNCEDLIHYDQPPVNLY